MIGLTGGIASGKSTVAKRLKELGAVVLDADQYSRQVVEPKTEGWELVRQSFPEVIKADLSIDRAKLGKLVFSHKEKRKILEGIIHPLVFRKIQEEGQLAKKAEDIVFAEVPLLYEVGWDQFMEQVWVVYVDPDLQLERLMKRNKIERDSALKMINSQWPLVEKRKQATRVIDNNQSLEQTFAQVDQFWRELKNRG